MATSLTQTGITFPDGSTQSSTLTSGMIAMWSGSFASIPAGWVVCDGTNGTPDLRGRFIIGIGSGREINTTGGCANVSLYTHAHSTPGLTSCAGVHCHGGSHCHCAYIYGDDGNAIHTHCFTFEMSCAGYHCHDMDGTGMYQSYPGPAIPIFQSYECIHQSSYASNLCAAGNHTHVVNVTESGGHTHFCSDPTFRRWAGGNEYGHCHQNFINYGFANCVPVASPSPFVWIRSAEPTGYIVECCNWLHCHSNFLSPNAGAHSHINCFADGGFHQHTYDALCIWPDGAHTHYWSLYTHLGWDPQCCINCNFCPGGCTIYPFICQTDDSMHGHAVCWDCLFPYPFWAIECKGVTNSTFPSSIGANGEHTHSLTLSPAGVVSPGENLNLPPFYALFFIMKT